MFIGISIISAGSNSEKANNNSHEENSKHHAYNSHIVLFLGGTTFYKNSASYFSIGLDYLYRPINERRPHTEISRREIH